MSDHSNIGELPSRELADEALSIVAAGKSDTFVRFGDIKGESTDKDHKDWVQIVNY